MALFARDKRSDVIASVIKTLGIQASGFNRFVRKLPQVIAGQKILRSLALIAF